MNTRAPFKILFVCTGNICRSPTADAVLRHKIQEAGWSGRITVDSAGTHGYHAGDAPDPRSISMALSRGIDMRDLRARKIVPGDFAEFDWIIAMDGGHHDILLNLSPKDARAELHRFTAFLGRPDDHVPDPYYGGQQGFVQVYDLIEEGCGKIIEKLGCRFYKFCNFIAFLPIFPDFGT